MRSCAVAVSYAVIGWLSTTSLQLSTSASRVLISSPVQHPSCMQPLLALGDELMRHGHEVYLTLPASFADYQYVERPGIRVLTFRADNEDRVSTVFGSHSTARLVTAANVDCDRMMSDQSFLDVAQKLHFDLVIVWLDVLSPCTLLLPRHIGVPFVSMSNYFVPWMIRVPVLPSFYVPSDSSSRTPGALLFRAIRHLVSQLVVAPQLWNSTLLSRHAPGVSSWEQLLLRSELILISHDQHFEPDLPLFPNIITVPGLTAGTAKPLPNDLHRTLAGGDATVVASFGSDLPVSAVSKILAACSQLERHRVVVVARFGTPPVGVFMPANVQLMSWLPQNDLLGHSRTGVFISQCGGHNGLYEALYHGVPVLGLPRSDDETATGCGRVTSRGLGIALNVDHFTADQLTDSILELLNNNSYRDAVRRLSSAWRDQPLVGRKKAGFWIEHVIKYGGSHLRSPAMDLPLHRFLMLDVLAVVSAWLLLATFFVVGGCRWWCCSRSRDRNSSDTKKQTVDSTVTT